nr:ATP-binding protein [Bacillus sp. B15-48]
MLQRNEERLQLIIRAGLFSIGVGVVFGVLLSLWSIQKITIRLRKVKEVMNSLENGSENLPRITIINNDEIGEIAKAYNDMAASLENHEKKERIYKEGMKEQNWLKTQLTELSMMSQELHDLSILGERYIQTIAPIIGANYGVIYLKEKKGNKMFLTKLASYANRDAKKIIEVGEDLAGQCLKEGKHIKLTNIPDNYVKITSGLGESKPKNIIILPIKIHDEVIAVIELASINEFTSLSETFLQFAMEQLGFVINRIQKQMEVKKLLEETQSLNDELQSQSEELQLQQEELQTMNEELEAQYKQSEQRSNALQEAKAALEEKTKQVLLSSQYKSEFLANMSHELRTPLNSLLILAQILVENKEGNLTNKQTEYANTIYSAGKDLLDLINEILDLSKIESGKVDFQISEIDIRGVTSFVKTQFSVIAEQKGIHFIVEVEDDVPAILYSDEQKIYQVLKNLVSNAMKFTEKGHVHLKVFKPEIKHHHSEQNLIAFSVTDTGIGIPKDKQELIFEAFQQADGTTSRKYGGTGLGLSISKRMADLLGGYLTVDSKVGKGSTFTFHLPLQAELNALNMKQEEVANEVAATIEENRSRDELVVDELSQEMFIHGETNSEKEDVFVGKTILLADDDMRNVFALTTALERIGLKVLFAENGKEALDILYENPHIDLVLMDIMMPGLDGYEAMREIRAKSHFEKLPIIALTAKAMKDDRQKCVDAGASDYISKPVNLEELFSLLKVWLY